MCAIPSLTVRFTRVFRFLPLVFATCIYHLFTYWSARSLASPGIGGCSLSSDRQSTSVPQPPITPKVHQPLDIHRYLSSQVTFNLIFGDFRTKFLCFFITEFPYSLATLDLRTLTNHVSGIDTDAVNCGQSYSNVLL